MNQFKELQFDIQQYLHQKHIQMLNSWSFDEYNKGDYWKATKIHEAKRNLVNNKIKWIKKGIVGRFIYKYLGI